MYERAVEDILTLESLRTIQKEKIDYCSNELLKLRSYQIENVAKIMFQEEKIKGLEQETQHRTKLIIDLEVKLSSSVSLIEERNMELREAMHKVNSGQMTAQSEKL